MSKCHSRHSSYMNAWCFSEPSLTLAAANERSIRVLVQVLRAGIYCSLDARISSRIFSCTRAGLRSPVLQLQPRGVRGPGGVYQMPATINVKSIVGVIIVIVVALSLLPIVLDSVTTAAASLTGAAKTMVQLVPLFYVIAVVLATVYWAVGKTR